LILVKANKQLQQWLLSLSS